MRKKPKPPEEYSVRHELEKLAVRLAGRGWKEKYEPEWTPIERLARDRTWADAERGDQAALQECWDYLWYPHEGIQDFEDDEKVWSERNGVVLWMSPKPAPVPDDWDSGDWE